MDESISIDKLNVSGMNASFSAAPQIDLADIAMLSKAGFRTIISARPDGEDEDQPDAGLIDKEAAKYGVEFEVVPFVPGQLNFDQVVEFDRLFRELPKPVLGFCKSGTRALVLWAISEVARGGDLDDIIDQTNAMGVDLAKYEPVIEAMALKLENV